MTDSLCNYCREPVPLAATCCPHCGRPSLFPNVRAAEDKNERAALAGRYKAAVDIAVARGCEGVLRDFENATRRSRAVIARPLQETERLTSSDLELYSTYYKLIEAGVRLPSGERWDKLRQLADVSLFGLFNAQQIRFAALSIEDVAPRSYGECCLVLREDRIAHRASLFHDNSAVLMARLRYDVLLGFRATWEDRTMLCVAKIAEHLQSDTLTSSFPGLLMQIGMTSEDERFVEVHIWGSITRRSLEKVRFVALPGTERPSQGRLKALRDRLAEIGVPLEVL